MRGGVQYDYILHHMTYFERDMMKTFVEKHLEAIKDHPYPVY